MNRTVSSTTAVANEDFIISFSEGILVTGAAGFIGARLVEGLLERGFRNVRCLVRPSSNLKRLNKILEKFPDTAVQFVQGNLLSREDCLRATEGVRVVYHLAAGRGEKSFPDAFANSVVTTRNLVEAVLRNGMIKRFVSVSSFTVYSPAANRAGAVLDENCPIEPRPDLRGEAYCYAKVKQDELVQEYGRTHGLPYVLIRPGVVYGAGNGSLTGRVGLGTFGIFLHFGGANPIPFTAVENCAEAMVLAGLRPGIDGEAFNIVDDDLPKSRTVLKKYKREVKRFPSIYFPPPASYLLCYLWEKYSAYSAGQLPPVYNRRAWMSYWKRCTYSNAKAKRLLGWKPRVPIHDGLQRHFRNLKEKSRHA